MEWPAAYTRRRGLRAFPATDGTPDRSLAAQTVEKPIASAVVMLFAAIAVCGLALLMFAYIGGRRSRRLAHGIAAVFAVALCAKAALATRADWEWWLLPWPAYALVQGFVLYALAAAFFGAAASTLPVRWNRLVVLAVGLGVLTHGLHRHAWLAWPEIHGDDRRAGADHHVRQSTHYTCGPAACASALSYCGITISERDLAAACLTRCSGSSLFDLYRGLVVTLRNCPFFVSIENPTADDVVAHRLLSIATNPGGGHALCFAALAGEVVVHDPLAPGPRTMTMEQLRAGFRGPAIVIRPAAAPPAAPPVAPAAPAADH